jgi:alpha-amylase
MIDGDAARFARSQALVGLAVAAEMICACATGQEPVLDGRDAAVAAPRSGPDAGAAVGAGANADAGAAARLAAGGVPPLGGAFVQLFEWTWSDIAKECQLFLGPKGFAAVQVSPPSEHALLSGYPWWQRYQTVGYRLDQSRSGTRAEFAAMVQACAAAGVDVYVDAVVNHMTGQQRGTGSNGTTYQKYDYPGLFSTNDFHQPPCQIAPSDYATSAIHVQTCELLGLADLNTGAGSVRTAIANYLAALIDLGVRGFRIDAAKHISPLDLDAILTTVAAATPSRKAPYYFFEVIDPGGEAIHASDYFDVGHASGALPGVTEFKFGAVGDKFLNTNGQTLADLKDLGSTTWALIPSDRAVVFTNNHDTQRAAAIFYQNAPYYDLANVFMLAWPYGYPSIMSGYAFDRTTQAGRDMGPPSDGQGHTTSVYSSSAPLPSCSPSPALATVGSWTCEHRVRSTANMVAFRKAAAGVQRATDWWDNGANQIAFGRGDRGFVVINRESTALRRRFQTELKSGRYCDVVGGDFAGTSCGGATIAVDSAGFADITALPSTAVAIHAEAMLP